MVCRTLANVFQKLSGPQPFKYFSAILNFLSQHNKNLKSVIVQRVKVSVAVLTDLNLLPHQTAIIQ